MKMRKHFKPDGTNQITTKPAEAVPVNDGSLAYNYWRAVITPFIRNGMRGFLQDAFIHHAEQKRKQDCDFFTFSLMPHMHVEFCPV